MQRSLIPFARKQAAAMPAESRIEISADAWPLVKMTYVGPVTPVQFGDALRECVRLAKRAQERGERLGWLVLMDAMKVSHLSAAKRAESAEVLRSYHQAIALGSAAEARVATSTMVRGLLTAVGWLTPSLWPVQCFATEQTALGWLKPQMTAAAPD